MRSEKCRADDAVLQPAQEKPQQWVEDELDIFTSAKDIAYGGQLAPPPEERRVQNLTCCSSSRRHDGRRTNKWISYYLGNRIENPNPADYGLSPWAWQKVVM